MYFFFQITTKITDYFFKHSDTLTEFHHTSIRNRIFTSPLNGGPIIGLTSFPWSAL